MLVPTFGKLEHLWSATDQTKRRNYVQQLLLVPPSPPRCFVLTIPSTHQCRLLTIVLVYEVLEQLLWKCKFLVARRSMCPTVELTFRSSKLRLWRSALGCRRRHTQHSYLLGGQAQYLQLLEGRLTYDQNAFDKLECI